MDETTPTASRTSVLFVCLGNICRSPLAEGVFRHLVDEAGMSDRFVIESAGTGAWHVGEQPDSRSMIVAEQHGVTLNSRARQVAAEDFQRFDFIIAMDHDNLRTLQRMAGDSDAKIELLRSFESDPDSDEVPDPYYGGTSGFETVYKMVLRSCKGLLDQLRAA